MEKGKEYKSALKVQEGITPPPGINPEILRKASGRGKKRYSTEAYADGIISGNRTILSQAITLIESSLPEHYEEAQKIIEKRLPYGSKIGRASCRERV